MPYATRAADRATPRYTMMRHDYFRCITYALPDADCILMLLFYDAAYASDAAPLLMMPCRHYAAAPFGAMPRHARHMLMLLAAMPLLITLMLSHAGCRHTMLMLFHAAATLCAP